MRGRHGRTRVRLVALLGHGAWTAADVRLCTPEMKPCTSRRGLERLVEQGLATREDPGYGKGVKYRRVWE